MAMVVKKIDSINEPAAFIASRLMGEIAAGKRVLWLLPGGSAIPVSVAAATLLSTHQLHNLIVGLTDERFGNIGHPDSNWKQLRDAGFNLDGAAMMPVLKGRNFSTTIDEYNASLKKILSEVEYSLGFFGIGSDGHTAGILPESSAITCGDYVCGYSSGQFERVTLTPVSIQALHEVVVYAVGDTKRQALAQLHTNVPLSFQPAQALKRVPRCTIFTDQTL